MTSAVRSPLHLPWSAWPTTTHLSDHAAGGRADACSLVSGLHILAIRFGAEIAPDRSRRPRCPASFVSTTAVEPIEDSAVWRTLLGFLDLGKFTAGGE